MARLTKAQLAELARVAKQDAEAREARFQASLPTVGTGFLRLRNTLRNAEKQPIAFIMRGTVNLPGIGPVMIESTVTPESTMRTLVLKEYKTWRKLGEVEVPFFGEFNYVEASLPTDGRTTKVRLIKQPEKNFILIKVPMAAKAEDRAAFR